MEPEQKQDYLEYEYAESELNNYEGCRNFLKLVLWIVLMILGFGVVLFLIVLFS